MTVLRHVDNASKGKNSKARGKADERDVARILGGKRHPADTGGDCDIDHPTLAIQCKGGGTVVTQIIRDGMASAKAAAAGTGKLPVLVVVDRRGTRLARYAIIDLAMFAAWNGFGSMDNQEE